jgi:hypothetical protein
MDGIWYDGDKNVGSITGINLLICRFEFISYL